MVLWTMPSPLLFVASEDGGPGAAKVVTLTYHFLPVSYLRSHVLLRYGRSRPFLLTVETCMFEW